MTTGLPRGSAFPFQTPVLLCFTAFAFISAAHAESLRFNRDIRPILSEACFHCHGQDASKRKADLRLDTEAGALAKGDDGAALVPGKPEESLLLRRMESKDPDEHMPPADSHRTVSPAQIALVRQWIIEGGKYETHWAFTPPVREPLPAMKNTAWPRQPWDAWVLTRLEKEGLSPTAEAKPETWLRRASFDLTGLPPAPAGIAAFEKDVQARGEAAYGDAADRLLDSPRFGERMTADWMDAARYADTHGFNNDTARSMWRWRDWVIGAFNKNLPYDQFITRQLAGDLLPAPSIDDQIATGFCRNHVINSEGGIVDEEYRVEYVADRVRTLGMTWLGLTLECSRCHDHKYDPLTAKDYYSFYAFFNQVPEWGEDGRIANAVPLMPAPTADQQEKLAGLDQRLRVESGKLAATAKPASDVTALVAWLKAEVKAPALTDQATLTLALKDGKVINPLKADAALGDTLAVTEDAAFGPVISFPETKNAKLDTAHFPAQGNNPWSFLASVNWQGGEGALLSNLTYDRPMSSTSYGDGTEVRINAAGQVEVRVSAKWPVYALQVKSRRKLTPGQWHQIAVVSHGKPEASDFSLFIDGGECETDAPYDGLSGNPGARPFNLGTTIEKTPAVFQGKLAGLSAFKKALTGPEITAWSDAAFVREITSQPDPSAAVKALTRVQDLALRLQPETREISGRIALLNTERLALMRTFPTTMVMTEMASQRPTHVLMRGNYDAPGDAVSPVVPEALLGAWPKGAPNNRLGLAAWLTKPDQPLTARVVVNRFWQQIFGVGLVKTAEDFGVQGEFPSHPELLDTLARDFADSGWNVKSLLRSIVLSATFRQDSRTTPELTARDPENRLLARGPRVRLPAEMIRDNALAVSGLLSERLGGPSVHPEQPADLYKGVVVDAPYPGSSWTLSTGGDLYRRSLYTFWKRTVPHPLMTVFDVPDREFGCVRRSRTNTPLQALAMLNEPSLLQAAGHLGARMRKEGGGDDARRLAKGFELCTSRQPTDREAAAMLRLLTKLRASFLTDADGAAAMVKTGGITATGSTTAETAAWTAVASNLLNLDETITRN
ncbi:MAG: DUF1553 domain-containing protein [Verrucomicrobiota bacterium]